MRKIAFNRSQMSTKTESKKMNDTTKKAPANTAAKGLASQTVAALRILVDGKTTKIDIPARGGRDARVMYQQNCVLIGGSRNVPFTKAANAPDETLSSGVYMFSHDCFKMGQYSLEFNRYDDWVYIGKMTDQQLQTIAPAKTTMDDIV